MSMLTDVLWFKACLCCWGFLSGLLFGGAESRVLFLNVDYLLDQRHFLSEVDVLECVVQPNRFFGCTILFLMELMTGACRRMQYCYFWMPIISIVIRWLPWLCLGGPEKILIWLNGDHMTFFWVRWMCLNVYWKENYVIECKVFVVYDLLWVP